jgi:hypothetical protein
VITTNLELDAGTESFVKLKATDGSVDRTDVLRFTATAIVEDDATIVEELDGEVRKATEERQSN